MGVRVTVRVGLCVDVAVRGAVVEVLAGWVLVFVEVAWAVVVV